MVPAAISDERGRIDSVASGCQKLVVTAGGVLEIAEGKDGKRNRYFGRPMKEKTQMSNEATTRNDLADMKVILDRAGVTYTETEGEIPGTYIEHLTLHLGGRSGTYFRFLFDDDPGGTVRLVEYGVTQEMNTKEKQQ
jgi:hypothetical protein